MKQSLRDIYFRRLIGYAFAYKGLLALGLLAGLFHLSLTFVYPWLIGSAIDRVIIPGAVGRGGDMLAREQWLWALIAIGVVTAVLTAFSGYARGHWTVKLGNRLIVDLRRDLFDHLQRLSLHFYSR